MPFPPGHKVSAWIRAPSMRCVTRWRRPPRRGRAASGGRWSRSATSADCITPVRYGCRLLSKGVVQVRDSVLSRSRTNQGLMSTDISLVRGNLPAEPNGFIGRERDLAELALLLTDVRVLTLCGTGGIGKTRLALRLGADVADGFPDGAWLAGLADVTSPAFVTARISAALGVREEPGQPLEATLADALGAWRVGALAVEQINGRLSDRFQLLAGGHRTAPPRQRTLRATVDWSYELLTEPEQLLLRRLAVFSGWDLDMAERVCADEKLPAQAVLDLLAALIDKSLVALDGEVAGGARYRLLDTIRQYAAERLAVSGEAAQMRRRHRDCLIELVESTAARGFRRGDPPWAERVRSYRRTWLESSNFG